MEEEYEFDFDEILKEFRNYAWKSKYGGMAVSDIKQLFKNIYDFITPF